MRNRSPDATAIIPSKRTPLYRDAAFPFHETSTADVLDQCKEVFDQVDKKGAADAFIYTRYANPTVLAAERQLAELEGCEWTALAPSGMSAIDIALSVFQSKDSKTWLFFSELYGGTRIYVDQVLDRRRNRRIDWFYPIRDSRTGQAKEHCDPANGKFSAALLDQRLAAGDVDLIFLETISNPFLIVSNLKEIIAIAQARKVKVIVDNTFATPVLCRPLSLHADLVVHSATKYLAGHGNVTAGLVCGNDSSLGKAARAYQRTVGSIVSPDDAYRLGTQAQTLDLRFRQQCRNAHEIARLFTEHDRVVKHVYYPGLATHPSREDAAKLFDDAGQAIGAMVTFELNGGKNACARFIREVSATIPYVVTLGDAETILLHVSSVFTAFPEESFGGVIRLSVGFENFDEVKKAIELALKKLAVD